HRQDQRAVAGRQASGAEQSSGGSSGHGDREMRLRASIILAVAAAALILTGAKIPENSPKYLSPSDLAISKDGRILYVVCEGSDELLAIDSQTNAVLHRVTVGRVPRTVALSSDGSLAYVTNSWSDTVSEVPTATFQVKRTLPAG